jgi:sulfoxide reductase heme-binding subunit YedZ
MTRAQAIRRLAKPLVWLAGLGVPAWLTWGAFHDALGPNPVETIQRWTGRGTLVGLLLALSITPLRRITGWNELIRLRRLFGLFAFFLGTLHFLSYVVFDQSLSLMKIQEDVVKHPWVFAGLSAWLLMLPLALTSTTASVRRLGGARWRRLHRLIYVAAAAGVLHFLWLVKRDTTTPALFGAVLVMLLAARLPHWSTQGRAASPRGARPAAPEPSEVPAPRA